MPEIGRWGVVDPLVEKFVSATPYNYNLNNPILLSDPNGMSPVYNWFTHSYFDDTNGNGSQDEDEEWMSAREAMNQIGNASTVALFPGFKKAGSRTLDFDGTSQGLEELLESAELQGIQGNYTVLHVGNEVEAASAMAQLPNKVSQLIVASHSDDYFPYFQIGSTTYKGPSRISESKYLPKIAKSLTVDAAIIFTGCNLGRGDGIEILKAVSNSMNSKGTNRSVFGNQSFTPGRNNLFQGGPEWPAYYLPAELKLGVPGFSQRQHQEAYNAAANGRKLSIRVDRPEQLKYQNLILIRLENLDTSNDKDY